MSELTKQQLKAPDQFQKFSRTILGWAQKNRRLLNGFLTLILVAGGAYAAWDYAGQRREGHARMALYEAQKIRQDMKEKRDEKKRQETDAAKKDDDKDKKKDDKKEAKTKPTPAPVPVTPEQLATLHDNALKHYRQVIQDFPGTAASSIAIIHATQMLAEDGHMDEAVQIFEKSKEPGRGQYVLLGAFLNQKAKIQAQKGDCKSAVATWEKVYTNPMLTVWHGDSLVKAAVCYEKLEQKDKAIELYKKAASDYKDSDAGRTAKKLLILAARTSESKG